VTGEYRELRAGAELDGFVECFWIGPASRAARSVLPDGCVDFVFSRSTGLQLVGTMTRPLLVSASNDAFVGVRFRPGMARCFLGASIVEITDRVLPLEDVWGRPGRALDKQLKDGCGPEEMLPMLQAALRHPSQVSPIQSALEFLARNGGMISLTEISRYAGVSDASCGVGAWKKRASRPSNWLVSRASVAHALRLIGTLVLTGRSLRSNADIMTRRISFTTSRSSAVTRPEITGSR
jgi:hypothetical protein